VSAPPSSPLSDLDACSQTPNDRCLLLLLSTEMRILIYEHLLTDPKSRYKAWPHKFNDLINLSRTCKDLWDEGIDFMNSVRTYTIGVMDGTHLILEGHNCSISERSTMAHSKEFQVSDLKLNRIQKLSINISAEPDDVCRVQTALYALANVLAEAKIKYLHIHIKKSIYDWEPHYPSPYENITTAHWAAFMLDPICTLRNFEVNNPYDFGLYVQGTGKVWKLFAAGIRPLISSNKEPCSGHILQC